MDESSLKDYLTCDSDEELTIRLMRLDASIMALHQYGFYVVNFDANNIKLHNGELSLSSFNDKLDYLNSGINANGDKKDILEICAIGICAYNGFSTFYTDRQFISSLFNDFDKYCQNGRIPEEMVAYYRSVLVDGNIEYLNNYMFKKNNESASNSQVSSNSYRLSKTTAIGKAFVDKEAAYINVLLLPALVVLIYFIVLIIMVVI